MKYIDGVNRNDECEGKEGDRVLLLGDELSKLVEVGLLGARANDLVPLVFELN
jgi:hypothetical protein